jgi:hypothetical protein
MADAALGARSAGWRGRRRPAATRRTASPRPWLLWLDLLFVLAVYFASAGLVGALRSKDEAAP